MSTQGEMRAGDTAARARARNAATFGIAALAQAFNHCQNASVPYVYAPEVQSRFKELAIELIRLVEDGEIIEEPAITAECNAEYQRLMSALKVNRKPPQRKKK